MLKILEKLWNEYFAEKCAAINTEEERALVKKAVKMHEKVNEALTKEQIEIIEKYIEAIYEIQDRSIKRAFFKGCSFAIEFLFGVRGFEG